MQEPENSQLVPHNLSFESLKKLNEHGVEYWSARDLQPCLGYSEWRKFENTIKKAITSCKQSGNDPDKHFVGADKMIGIGKQAKRKVADWYLSRLACYLIAQNGDSRKPEMLMHKSILPFKLDAKRFQTKWLLISKGWEHANKLPWNSKLYLALLEMLEFKIKCSASSMMPATRGYMGASG